MCTHFLFQLLYNGFNREIFHIGQQQDAVIILFLKIPVFTSFQADRWFEASTAVDKDHIFVHSAAKRHFVF